MSETNQERYDELQSRYEDLQDGFDRDDLERRLERIGDTADNLPVRLAELREKGYPYRADLDTQANTLRTTWKALAPTAVASIDAENNSIAGARSMPASLLTQAERLIENDAMFGKLADQVENGLERLETANEEANERVEKLLSDIEEKINALSGELRDIEKVMKYAEDITFELTGGETVYMAAEAELILTGKSKQDPDGIVFLTSERIVFEQREKTGKRMGMFGGKMEHEVEWETPLSAVSDINTENKGIFKGRDIIHITSDGNETTLELKGRADNDTWAEAIQQMQNGEVE